MPSRLLLKARSKAFSPTLSTEDEVVSSDFVHSSVSSTFDAHPTPTRKMATTTPTPAPKANYPFYLPHTGTVLSQVPKATLRALLKLRRATPVGLRWAAIAGLAAVYVIEPPFITRLFKSD